MPKKVFILSGASFDTIVYLPEFPQAIPQTIHQSVFTEGPGSTGVGKAANLCRLGFDTRLQLLVGNDWHGQQILEYLGTKEIKLFVDTDPAGTERHVNLMNSRGERISIFITSASSLPPIDYSRYEQEIIQADTIVLNIVDYARHFIPLIRKHKKEVWTDLHDYTDENPYHEDFINASDYIFLSSDNLTDYRNTMQKLMARGKKLVVCTHGKKGATALSSDGKWIDMPVIESFEVKDTNGAGDAFFSGFLYAHKKGLSVKECLLYGHILGGMCVNSEKIAADNLSIQEVEKHFRNLA